MIETKPTYDAATIADLRGALDAVLMDRLFLEAPSISALEVAEHILAQAARGQRDFDHLKSSALRMIETRCNRNAA